MSLLTAPKIMKYNSKTICLTRNNTNIIIRKLLIHSQSSADIPWWISKLKTERWLELARRGKEKHIPSWGSRMWKGPEWKKKLFFRERNSVYIEMRLPRLWRGFEAASKILDCILKAIKSQWETDIENWRNTMRLAF